MGKKKEDFDAVAEGLLGDRDIDDDSVLNMNDCRPLDPERQDIKGAFKTMASKLKSGASKLKKKYEQAKKRREAKKRGEEIEEAMKRKKKLKELERKEKELEQKKKIKEKERQLKKKKKEIETIEGPGVFDQLGNFLDKLAGPRPKRRAARARRGNVDRDDKWAVVRYSDHSIERTFRYKSDAKDYSSGRDNYGVMRTKTALKKGYDPTGEQTWDIFGPNGRESMDDALSFVTGSKKKKGKERDEMDEIRKDVIGW